MHRKGDWNHLKRLSVNEDMQVCDLTDQVVFTSKTTSKINGSLAIFPPKSKVKIGILLVNIFERFFLRQNLITK